MTPKTIPVLKLQEDAVLPHKDDGDAGWDLHSTEDIKCPSQDAVLVSTGIAMEIPENHVGLLWDRSGMASKKKFHRMAGVIDSSYRGEIKVLLQNNSHFTQYIAAGDKIAQILIQEVPEFEMKEVKELNETKRGDGGFGSTGEQGGDW